MKGLATKLIAGVFALIALYLVLFHSRALVNVLNAVGTWSIQGIQVLQGRVPAVGR